MRYMIYCIDLDGTLYDNSHRLHLIPSERSNTAGWVEFNGACAGDTVRKDVLDLVHTLIAAGKDVRFLTGRGEAARSATLDKLDEDHISRPLLYMRPMGDHRPAAQFKADVIRGWLAGDAHVMAIEDEPAIVEALRGIDRVTVLHIDSLCCAVGG